MKCFVCVSSRIPSSSSSPPSCPSPPFSVSYLSLLHSLTKTKKQNIKSKFPLAPPLLCNKIRTRRGDRGGRFSRGRCWHPGGGSRGRSPATTTWSGTPRVASSSIPDIVWGCVRWLVSGGTIQEKMSLGLTNFSLNAAKKKQCMRSGFWREMIFKREGENMSVSGDSPLALLFEFSNNTVQPYKLRKLTITMAPSLPALSATSKINITRNYFHHFPLPLSPPIYRGALFLSPLLLLISLSFYL